MNDKIDLIVVYVGQASEKNLKHGIEKGVWGFKERVFTELKEHKNINSYLILAGGYSGGSPRTDIEEWNRNKLQYMYIGKITSEFFKNTSIEWEDEKNMDETDRYIWRFNFEVMNKIENISLETLDVKISDNLRISAIAQSRGKLIDNFDRFDFIGLLENNTIIGNEEFNSNTFYEDLVKANLKYEKSFIDRFIASLLTKPFVLLTGLSGSGKTKLAQAFVKWLCKDESQYAIISVGANWTNRDPLLGYVNALDTNNYIYPENECLKILINASKFENQNKPYFLILDEMNLSHVERYFADFLSSMESGADIKLHSTNNNEVPQKINISKNVFIIGTVNIDETTYMFSPKVLDRANVLEFKVTNDMMKQFLENPVKIDMQDIYSKGFLMNDDYMKKYLKTYNDFENKEFIVNELLKFFNELKDLGAEYGFRTATEIFRFIAILREITPDIEVEKCIDYAIVQKLLPKIHGSRKRLQPILKKLGELCIMDNRTFEDYLSANIESKNIKYPVSLEKINRMYSRLLNDGFTSFAEA